MGSLDWGGFLSLCFPYAGMSLRYVLGYSTKEYRYFRKILGDLAGFDVGSLRLRSSPYSWELIELDGESVAAQPKVVFEDVPLKGWAFYRRDTSELWVDGDIEKVGDCEKAYLISLSTKVCVSHSQAEVVLEDKRFKGELVVVSGHVDRGVCVIRLSFPRVARIFLGGEIFTAYPDTLVVEGGGAEGIGVAFTTLDGESIFIAKPPGLPAITYEIPKDLGRPKAVALGYRSASVLTERGHSVVVLGDNTKEIMSYPFKALVKSEKGFVGVSGKWLVMGSRSEPKILLELEESPRGVGELDGYPVVSIGSSIYIATGSSAYLIGKWPSEISSALGSYIAVDLGEMAALIDSGGSEVFSIAKDPDARCFASGSKSLLCLYSGFASIVEPGESYIEVGAYAGSEGHIMTVETTVPLLIDGRECLEGCSRLDSTSSVLRKRIFRAAAVHPLGKIPLVAISSPSLPAVEVEEAVAVVSPGEHICGGVGMLRIRGKIKVGSPRVRLTLAAAGEVCSVLDGAHNSFNIETCITSPVDSIDIYAEDPIAGDRLPISKIAVEAREIPPPRISFEHEHLDGETIVRAITEEGSLIEDAEIHCGHSTKKARVEGSSIHIEECRIPARVSIMLRRGEYRYRYSYEIPLPREIITCISRSIDNPEELAICRHGGLVASLVPKRRPDLGPLAKIERVSLGKKGMLKIYPREPITYIAIHRGIVTGVAGPCRANEIEIPDYDPMREIILVVKGSEKRIYKIEPESIERLILTASSLAIKISKTIYEGST